MNNNLKQNLDEISADLIRARKTNAPTYWLFLVFAGILVTGLTVLIFTKTGIVLMVTSCFVYTFNNLLNAWIEIRKSERESENVKTAKKIPPRLWQRRRKGNPSELL